MEEEREDKTKPSKTRYGRDFRSYTCAFGLGISQVVLGATIIALWAVSVKDVGLYVAPERRFITPGIAAIVAGIFAIAGAQAGARKTRTGLTATAFVLSLIACATTTYVGVVSGQKLAEYLGRESPPLLICLEFVSVLEAVLTILQMIVSGDAVWFGRHRENYRVRAIDHKRI